jgi:hypothetical protein
MDRPFTEQRKTSASSLTGIAVSDSILIVEFVGTLRKEGMALKRTLSEACIVRLRPILMMTMATILGLIPMALALEPGSEQYALLARVILGGLSVSGIVMLFFSCRQRTCLSTAMKSTAQSKGRPTHESKSNDFYHTPSIRTWRIGASFSELLIHASKCTGNAIAFCRGSVGIDR